MDIDLSKLYINIKDVPKGKKIVEHYPELQQFEEFKIASDNEVKIAILLGDSDSPFIKHKNRDTQLHAIYDYLDLPLHTKEQKEIFSLIVEYRYMPVIMCWIRYLEILNETHWTDWCVAKHTYNFLLNESTKEKPNDEKLSDYVKRRVEIQDNIQEIGKTIRGLEAIIFPNSKAAREAALLKDNKIETYAEKYAEPYTHI